MKKFFLALCAMILVAQPSIKADSMVCVNITEVDKDAAISLAALAVTAGFICTMVNGSLAIFDACEYVDYKIKNMSHQLKNLMTSSTLTALSMACMYGAYKAGVAIENL